MYDNHATKREVIKYYTNLSNEYDDKRFATIKQRITSKFQIDWFCSKLNRRHGILLEVGSGTGRLTSYLLHFSDILIASDASSSMLKILKDRLSLQNNMNQVELILCDASHLPFMEKSFNGIVAARILWHLPDVIKSIEESIRILQKKGLLLFDFPNKIGPFSVMKTLRRKKLDVLMLFATFNQLKSIGEYFNVDYEIVGNGSCFLYFLPSPIFSIKGLSNIILPFSMVIEKCGSIWPFREFSNSWFIKYEKVV